MAWSCQKEKDRPSPGAYHNMFGTKAPICHLLCIVQKINYSRILARYELKIRPPDTFRFLKDALVIELSDKMYQGV